MGAGIVQILIQAKDMTAAAFATTKAKLAMLKGKVSTVSGGFTGLGSKISSVMSAAIAPIMLVIAAVYAIGKAVGSALTSFGDFDTAMKSVEKTTGMSKEGIEKLNSVFKEMSTVMPLSAKALAEIGAVAGQLGIQGVDNIATFTETVAKVSIALQMTAEDAATAMAKIGNAFQLPVTAANDFASAINSLENTTAAAGSEIIGSMTRMAASGAQLGLTADQAAALGATLISTGMAAERVGTRLNRAFIEMAKNTAVMAEQMGVSNEQMRHSIETDVMGALNDYIVMLSQTPSAIDRITKANEVFGSVGGKAIAMLSSNHAKLGANIQTANVAMREGTSLHEEYMVFASSFDAQMEVLKNKTNIFAMEIGKKLAPAILSIGTSFTDTVIPGLVTFGKEISKQTEETWPNFKKAVSEAFGKLVGDSNLVTWENIMTGLGVAIGTALNVILIGLTLLIEANGPFLTAIGGMVTCLTEFVSDIQNLSVKEAFSNLKDNIFTALGNIKDEIGSKVSPIVDAIITGLGKVKGKVGTIFEGVKDTIFTKLSSIKEGLGVILDPVKTAIHDKLAGIKDGLAEKLAPVTTVVLDALSKIKDGLDPILDPVKTAIHDKLGAIKDGLAEKLAPVKTAIEGVFTSAVGIIETKFADLPTSIGTIFTTIGEIISAFGESLPDFLGSGISDLGEAFVDLGDAFTTPSEDIKADIDNNIIAPLDTDVPAATISASTAMDSFAALAVADMGIIGIGVNLMKGAFTEVPTEIAGISDATGDLGEDVKEDLDKVTITVDGVKVSFEGLKGKISDVVTEFGNFEDIAGELIGLDWGVFTTLKDELPKIDKGIDDMKEAFSGLKKVLDDNIDNLATIQEDLGDIDKAITPFVDAISPGITAVGSFGKALSDTQSALSVFASMSEIDLEGMLGFEGAVHSMVMGLEILGGQIERLMPSFADIADLSKRIVNTFIEGSEEGTNFEQTFHDIMTSGKRTGLVMDDLKQAFMDLGDSEFIATYRMQQWIGEYNTDFLPAAENADEAVDKFTESQTFLSYQMDLSTKELRIQTGELNKISDAIQPLLNFMNQLNELYASVFGEKAAVWDAVKVQEVFGAIEETIRLFGETLSEVDFGEFIDEAVENSEGFMTAMRDQGSELNILTNYIDILLGYYVDLAELMGRLAEAEEDIGEEGFEVADAFGAINDYMQGLITYLPELTVGLSALSDIWDENTDTISESMTAFHKIIGVIKAINLSYADFTETMIELSQTQETGIALGVDLSKGFEMMLTFVDGLTGVIPKLATELNTLNNVWNQNNEVVNRGAIAFVEAMKPIQTVGDIMLDFSDVMVLTGQDVSAGFDNIIDYVAELTDFTPRLGLALSDLKTVWDENSGAIEVGMDAFSNIVGAISDVQTSIGDLVASEGELETAAGDAAAAIDTESDALAGSSLTTSADAATGSSVQLTGATGELMGAISSLAGAINGAAATFGGLVSAMSGALSVMNSLAGGAYSAGAAFGNSFADGIYSAMGSVEGAAGALAGVVADYLAVHSNTELGALSDLMSWGPNLVKAFVQGIRGELGSLSKVLNEIKVGELNKAVNEITMSGVNKVLHEISLGNVNMTSAMASGSGGGSSVKNVHITINQNINSREDARFAVTEIERLMKKKQIV